MSCNFIASDIHKKLCEDYTTPVKHLRSMIETKYNGHKPSYYKVWDAKQKAIVKMFRNLEESYQRLQKLLMAYIDQDPTTKCSIVSHPPMKMTPYCCIMCFGLSVHAYQDSNTASRLSVLMGPICIGNIRESYWSQWQLTLTTRYCLLSLLL